MPGIPKVGAPRVAPPPLPSQRNLDQLGTGADFRSHRLTGGFESDAPTLAPVNAWVDVVSTWVLRARFDPHPDLPNGQKSQTGDWKVEFLDGSLVAFRMTPAADWIDFFQSSSKGSYIYHKCKLAGRAYDTLRGPQRKVSAKHRFLRDVTRNEGRPR